MPELYRAPLTFRSRRRSADRPARAARPTDIPPSQEHHPSPIARKGGGPAPLTFRPPKGQPQARAALPLPPILSGARSRNDPARRGSPPPPRCRPRRRNDRRPASPGVNRCRTTPPGRLRPATIRAGPPRPAGSSCSMNTKSPLVSVDLSEVGGGTKPLTRTRTGGSAIVDVAVDGGGGLPRGAGVRLLAPLVLGGKGQGGAARAWGWPFGAGISVERGRRPCTGLGRCSCEGGCRGAGGLRGDRRCAYESGLQWGAILFGHREPYFVRRPAMDTSAADAAERELAELSQRLRPSPRSVSACAVSSADEHVRL